ncbi:helix-turn-helix domain-containing protein [Actinoplanes sp. CA-051413]|uniref:helix-turn-helix domain-containing protein n=1 Tax=Actinoplanes sp. CA-051413 TaxID=3239899 RepID=UPI003D999509
MNPRTGTRRRSARTVTSADGESKTYSPIATPKQDVSARYLSEDERVTIAEEHRAGRPIRGIAKLLDRAPSTMGREINHPLGAHQRVAARRPRLAPAKPECVGENNPCVPAPGGGHARFVCSLGRRLPYGKL